MWVFPLAAAAVSLYFAALLTRQFGRRRRPNLLAWAVALTMFATASAATALGMLAGWSETTYRLYYLFGAILNVPVLAAGTVYLLAPRRYAHLFAVLVGAGTVVAIVAVLGADVAAAGLDTTGIPRSAEVMPGGVRAFSRYFSIVGFLIVLAGALWSAARLWRRRERELKRLAVANLLIAAGTTVVAVASEVARNANGSVEGSIFAVGLFVGVTVMFWGFLKTRPQRPV